MYMRLSDYLDRFSWSQAQLAREAGISPQSVARALAGQTITRRNAEAIIWALQRKYKEQGLKGAITLASVKGLHVSELRRKQSRQPIATQEQGPQEASEQEGQAEG